MRRARLLLDDEAQANEIGRQDGIDPDVTLRIDHRHHVIYT